MPEIGFNHFLVIPDFLGAALGQYGTCSHTDYRVAHAPDKIHIVLDHAKCVILFLVEFYDRITNFLQQGPVYPCANLV